MIYKVDFSKDADKTLRIIYDIFDSRVSVLVVQVEEHYNDK